MKAREPEVERDDHGYAKGYEPWRVMNLNCIPWPIYPPSKKDKDQQ